MYRRLRFTICCLLCLSLQASKAQEKRLTSFLAPCPMPDAPAVIVCPGGSYSWLDMKTEGKEVAQWLQANGISAFVLKYRVQGIVPYITHSRLLFKGNQYPDALYDLQQAIQHVREHATEYNINPNKLGVMGFSAGGHLALCGASLLGGRLEGGCPSFIAAIYPVVSMSHPVSHKRSRRALCGNSVKTSGS